MPSPQTVVRGNDASTASYALAPGVFQYIESVLVEVDGTAGPDATPTLFVKTQDGQVIATKRQGEAIPAGDTGTATWALRLTDSGDARAVVSPVYVLRKDASQTIDEVGTFPIFALNGVTWDGWTYGSPTIGANGGVIIPTAGLWQVSASIGLSRSLGALNNVGTRTLAIAVLDAMGNPVSDGGQWSWDPFIAGAKVDAADVPVAGWTLEGWQLSCCGEARLLAGQEVCVVAGIYTDDVTSSVACGNGDSDGAGQTNRFSLARLA